MGRGIFMAPLAAGAQVDDLRDVIAGGNFQAQVKNRAHHHRQVADEHQTVFRDIADVANGFVGDTVEDFEKIRQLEPLDPAFCEHAEYRFAKALEQGRTTASQRAGSAGSLSPIAVRTSLPCARATSAALRYQRRSASTRRDVSQGD